MDNSSLNVDQGSNDNIDGIGFNNETILEVDDLSQDVDNDLGELVFNTVDPDQSILVESELDFFNF